MYIDTHCHLNFKAFKKDLELVLHRATASHVEKIIIPGAKLDSSYKAIEISQQHPQCFAAIGVHPHHSQSLNIDEVKKELTMLLPNKKIVAIGEIGLDYFTYKEYPPITSSQKLQQKNVFHFQLELAQDFHLPVILHCRNAFDDMLEFISVFQKGQSRKLIGVFHCFGGDVSHLKKVLDLGFYVGYDGNISYPENSDLRDCVKQTPLDRLLLETDSPFLTPQAFRRTRNEPSYLPLIAQEIVKIHNVSIENLSKITSQNAIKLFQL